MNYQIEKPDETMKDVAIKIGYKGRKIKVNLDYIPSNLNSFWDGGSRDYWYFYQLSTGKILEVESNHPMFETNNPRELKQLPEGIILTCHSIFCGKDCGLTFYMNDCDRVKFLPEKTDGITGDEKLVLKYTSSLKNTYGGRTNIRFTEAHRETGITSEKWVNAKRILIEKRMLNPLGAITPKGRNTLNFSKVTSLSDES